MEIIEQEDMIVYQICSGPNEGKIICEECGDPGENAMPLSKDDFLETDIVTCDECGERIF